MTSFNVKVYDLRAHPDRARWLVSNGCLTCLQSWSVVEQMFRPQAVRRRG
jgi:hypothetical protein